jgi:hypothetical protein
VSETGRCRTLRASTVAPLTLKWGLLRAYLGFCKVKNLKSIGFALNGYLSGQFSRFLQ